VSKQTSQDQDQDTKMLSPSLMSSYFLPLYCYRFIMQNTFKNTTWLLKMGMSHTNVVLYKKILSFSRYVLETVEDMK